jgi:hypothetical protein
VDSFQLVVQGAAHPVDDAQRIRGRGVRAPGHVLVGSQEDQVLRVEPAGAVVADMVLKPEQGEPGADEVEPHALWRRGVGVGANDRRAFQRCSRSRSRGPRSRDCPSTDLSPQPLPRGGAVPAFAAHRGPVAGHDGSADCGMPRGSGPVPERHGPPVDLVCLQERRATPSLDLCGECPADANRVAHTGVHAIAPGGRDLVDCVAGEPYPAQGGGFHAEGLTQLFLHVLAEGTAGRPGRQCSQWPPERTATFRPYAAAPRPRR